MNQSQIHPALRQNPLVNPPNPPAPPYTDNAVASTYSPGQSSPNNSYQTISPPNYYPGNQAVEDSPESDNPGGNPNDPNDLKRPRACEACRQLKVKCEPDESNPNGSCKRCAKAHRNCVVTAPSRKRQKKTDSRVAELEKKIDALTATLAARGGDPDVALEQQAPDTQASHPQSSYDPWQSDTSLQKPSNQPPSTPAQNPATKRKLPDVADYFGGDLVKSAVRQRSMPPVPPYHSHGESKHKAGAGTPSYVDVVDRGIIDAPTAYKCFDRYVMEMCMYLPAVVFQPNTKAEDVRRTKPILFLAAITFGCGTIRPDLQSQFTSEVTKLLADRVVCTGEKSLELVQALQILTIFYQPPEKYEELNFNQLIHIAAVMALDIGMGKRSKKSPYTSHTGYMDKNKMMPDPNSAETRRSWLGCYYMCANSSMSLRRPCLVRWSAYTKECIEILSRAKDALPTDKWLCHIVKAQHIAEDIGTEFFMDDPAQTLKLTDPQTQKTLKRLEQRLAEWRESAGDLMQSPIMKHTEAIINLYMHEISMHRNHNVDEFRPPYNSTPIEGPPEPESLTPALVESLTACLTSAHNAFEAFLSMDAKTLRAIPTHFFVRNSYAAVALIKLYSAVSAPGSKFAEVFKTEQLKVDHYLDRLIQIHNKISEGNVSRVAHKFTLIFTMLRNWHLRRTEPQPAAGPLGRDFPSIHQRPGPIPNHNPPATMAPPLPSDPTMAWTVQSRMQLDQPQNRLQILSDAAMDPNRPIPPPSTSQPLHQTPSQVQWMTPPPPPPPPQMSTTPNGSSAAMMPPSLHHPHHPHHPQQHPHQQPQPDYNNMMISAFGYSATDHMVNGGFTSDDFMAFGLGDDWMNFSFNMEGNGNGGGGPHGGGGEAGEGGTGNGVSWR